MAVVEGGSTGTLELTEENVEIVLDEVCICFPSPPGLPLPTDHVARRKRASEGWQLTDMAHWIVL